MGEEGRKGGGGGGGGGGARGKVRCELSTPQG